MENINQNNKKFGSKKSKSSILSIGFSAILAAGALAGSGVGIWNIAKNYTDSAEFTKTVSGRIKIDPAALLDDDQKKLQTKQEAEDIVKDCADKLSRWLKDSGQKSYDVSYEVYDKGEDDNQYFGYLSANFEVSKINKKHITSEDDKEKKIDNDPYLSFFDSKAFNSNEKTIVYRWYIENPGEEIVRPKYSIIPFRQLFSIPKKVDPKDPKVKPLVDSDGNNGVLFTINDQPKLKAIFEDLAKAKQAKEQKDPEPSNDDIKTYCQPRLYVVNNLQGLCDEANYHIANWMAHDRGEDLEYDDIYKDSDYANFANSYYKNDIDGSERKTDDARQRAFKLDSAISHDDEQVELENIDLFNYIDQATPGTNAISFTNKYVDKIVTIDDFDKIIPKKITDDYKNDVNFDNWESWEINSITYLWYQTASKNDATTYLNNQIKYGFDKATIVNFDFSDITGKGVEAAKKVLDKFQGKELKKTDIAPTFTETIFGGSHLVGILSLGFLIFLVTLLILLAVLYRTTGVMSWICMIFALSMTALIATIGSTAISMSLLFGLFTLAVIGFMASLTICGRMKRRLRSHEDTQVMISKTFKKSLLPMADISVITLIFGVCFIYIAPISLNSLGLVLTIGAFLTFISVYLFNGLLHILFFNNKAMIGKYQFFGKPSNKANEMLAQSNNAVPVSMDATRLELPYFSTMSKKKIDATGKRALIALCVVAVLLIAGIIVFSVLGFTSASIFHTTNCIMVRYEGDLVPLLPDFSYVSIKHDTLSNWWYIYTNAGNTTQIAQTIAETLKVDLGIDVLAQGILGSTNQDILNFALISILVATLCSAVYAALRYNWIAFIPMVLGAFAVPLLILGIASICQVKFDQFVVTGFVFVTAINSIFSMTLIGSINEAWSRKDAYTNSEFKYIVNVALSNDWTFIWNTAVAYLLFILLFGLTAPIAVSTVSTIVLLVIACIITIIITPLTTSFVLYQFMKVRNSVLNRIVERNKNKVIINYDDIDEQGIEGINQFTKKIPVSKPQNQQGE
ncbi:MAG: hypothetical protein KBS35_01715 [Mycoplasma sp.]|nr:hypothetical protein [Candidatus Hennigella equi]